MPRACPALATRVLVDHTSTRPSLSTRSLVVTGMKNGNRPFSTFPVSRFPLPVPHGGAGNRTPVRASLRCHSYVRRRRFIGSPCPGASPAQAATSLYQLLRDLLRPEITPARLCDT